MSSPLKDSLSDIPLLPKDLATDVQKLSLSQTPKSFTFKQNQEAARVPVESTAQNLASPGASSSVARQQTSSQSPQAPRKVSLSHVHTSLRAALGSNNSPPKLMMTNNDIVNRALSQIKWHSTCLLTFNEGRDKCLARNDEIKRELDEDVKIRLSYTTANAQQKKHELQLIIHSQKSLQDSAFTIQKHPTENASNTPALARLEEAVALHASRLMIAGVDYSSAKGMQLACFRKLRVLEAEFRDGERRVNDYAPSVQEMQKERGEILEVIKGWTKEVQGLVNGVKEGGKGEGEEKKGFEIGKEVLVGKVNEEHAWKVIGLFARKYVAVWGKDGIALGPVVMAE